MTEHIDYALSKFRKLFQEDFDETKIYSFMKEFYQKSETIRLENKFDFDYFYLIGIEELPREDIRAKNFISLRLLCQKIFKDWIYQTRVMKIALKYDESQGTPDYFESNGIWEKVECYLYLRAPHLQERIKHILNNSVKSA